MEEVLPRDNKPGVPSILGKGERPRHLLLPDVVKLSLLMLRGERLE
jgi:hypothetical protein